MVNVLIRHVGTAGVPGGRRRGSGGVRAGFRNTVGPRGRIGNINAGGGSRGVVGTVVTAGLLATIAATWAWVRFYTLKAEGSNGRDVGVCERTTVGSNGCKRLATMFGALEVGAVVNFHSVVTQFLVTSTGTRRADLTRRTATRHGGST